MSFTVLAVAGSLRTGSSNTGLVRMAERIIANDPTIGLEIVSTAPIAGLPFYDADLEDPERTPDSVLSWRDQVRSCDALFIASPEYNYGPTAVLKNAIDWASRPLGQHALRGKAISLLSSSASTGGQHMSEQLTHILTLLGNTLVLEPEGLFVKGAERISADGSTTDPSVEQVVRTRLAGLVDILRSRLD